MPTLGSEIVGKGVTFTNAFVSNPWCCPSRATILRGQYSHTTGVYDNAPPNGGFASFRDYQLQSSTLGTWLQAAGYRTALMGKYLNGYGGVVVPPGWDFWRGSTQGYYNYKVSEQGVPRTYGSTPSDYQAVVMAGYADLFIRSTPLDTPLFLWVSTYAPHDPYTPHPTYASDPRCEAATNTDAPAFNEADVSDKPAYIRQKGKVNVQSIGVDRPRAQCRTLLSVDDLIGTVVGALADTGRLADTLLVFTSDNGHANGEHRWNAKRVPYESSIRVPLVVRYDALTAGVARTEPEPSIVANVDIAPTIVDLLGLDVTPGCPSPAYGGSCSGGFDGVSFLPAIAGSPETPRSELLIEHHSVQSTEVPAYCGIRTRRTSTCATGRGSRSSTTWSRTRTRCPTCSETAP
jgi:arylsulfatase A-like enzyme